MKQPRTPNVLAVWNRATEGEREYGENWYPMAHKAAARIAKAYGVSVPKVAGVISALSPNNKWHQNLVDAETFVEFWTDAKTGNWPTASTYPVGRQKAIDILTGLHENPVDAFMTGRAHKTLAFYLSIAFPYPSLDTVVVDGHAWNIATNQRLPLDKIGSITARRYEACSMAYVRAAIVAGVTPQAMQATCWLAWRRLANWQLDFEDMLLTTERM